MDREKIRHAVVLGNLLSVPGQELEEDVTGKQRLLEYNGFSPIFVDGSIAGKDRDKAFSLTILFQLLFLPRPCMGDEPRQIAHGVSIVTIIPPSRVQDGIVLIAEVLPWRLA